MEYLSLIKLLELVKYLGFSYSARKFYHRKICQRFYHYHVREIMEKANSYFRISPSFDLIYVFNQPSFRGLINTLFEPNNFYFSCTDIAIAVNITIHGYCNKDYVDNESIVDFAYHFSDEVKERVRLDPLLSKELTVIGKDVKLIIDDTDRNEVNQAFSSKKTMFRHYFKTFEAPGFDKKVIVWHQNEDQCWIVWDTEDSIAVSVNPQKIREGFFLMGFDYSSDTYGSLDVATNDGRYEYFNDVREGVEIAWAR
jgi:hypothetical protein